MYNRYFPASYRPPQNNPMARFNQFKSMFNGDPKQQVQQLLDSGQMTQEQFERLSQMADNMYGMLYGKR